MQASERGEYREALELYERFLSWMPTAEENAAESAQAIWSANFNMAMVLNKLGQFQRAVTTVQHGLALAPAGSDRARGLAAQGEALCAMGRPQQGMDSFLGAREADPLVGRQIGRASCRERV